jgi:hypothetical protein
VGAVVSIEYRIDKDVRLEVATFLGRVEDPQMLDYVRRLVADPDHDPTMDTLVDLRGVEEVEVTTEGVRALSDLVSQMGRRLRRSRADRPARVALLADRPVTYGVSRMYETFREAAGAPYEIRVFRDLDAARAWVGPA